MTDVGSAAAPCTPIATSSRCSRAALRDGTAVTPCVFELFARRLPGGTPLRRRRRHRAPARPAARLPLRRRRARASCATSEIVDADDPRRTSRATASRGSIAGYREGELYFPGSPILTVEGTFADAVVLETLALSVLNHDSAVATAAARMSIAAGERPLAEMGSRRAGEQSAVAAARAAYIAGFGATSNLEAGRRWGIPTMGTAAHAWTLLHDTEEEAFRAQIDALGTGTTLLVDTYDIRTRRRDRDPRRRHRARRRAHRLRRPADRRRRGARAARRARRDRARASPSPATSTSTRSRPRRLPRRRLRGRHLGRHRLGLPDRGHGLQARRATGCRSAPGSRSRRPPPTRPRSAVARPRSARSTTASPTSEPSWSPTASRARRMPRIRALRRPRAAGDVRRRGRDRHRVRGPEGTGAAARITTPRARASSRFRRSPSASPTRRSRPSYVDAVTIERRSGLQRLVDLFARGADRELLRVATRRPLLAAQRAHRLAGDRRLEDLLFLDVVREALVVAGFDILFAEQLLEFAIERCQAALIGADPAACSCRSVYRRESAGGPSHAVSTNSISRSPRRSKMRPADGHAR